MKESMPLSRANIINFNRKFLDQNAPLSCIGQGALGGKAQGLAFIRTIINSELDPNEFTGILIDIPSLAIICTEVFDIFLERNKLHEVAYSDLPDDRIAYAFQRAEMPFEVLGDLRALIDQVHTPLAIRSSSLLEDSTHTPYAGVYGTKLIPNKIYDPDIRFRQLVEAIKYVYASTFFKSAKDYRRAINHNVKDEKMAVIIQELVGKRYLSRFYPELSGVARSYNYYPMHPAKPEDGVVNLALGLGKTIVDGGISWMYSPSYPKREPPFGSVEMMINGTQIEFWGVNMGEPPEYNPIKETEYLVLDNIVQAEKDNALRYLASTYYQPSGSLIPGTGIKGPRVLTFAPLLILKELPFNELIATLLFLCEKALDSPVEIEFAMTFNPHRFGFLQVRSMIGPLEETIVKEEELNEPDVLIASESALGNGVINNIRDIVYIKPEGFELKHSRSIIPDLERINLKLLGLERPYLLIVFGRLGTTDPWLGIPINWGQIGGARAIVEATKENIRMELSQGSHFFHNMINLGVKYFSLSFTSRYQIHWDWLEKQEVVEETQFLCHVRFSMPLLIKVDGRSGRGVIKTFSKAENGRISETN